MLVDNFVLTKRQELQNFQKLTPEEQVNLYLDTV
jgi:glutamine synthetase